MCSRSQGHYLNSVGTQKQIELTIEGLVFYIHYKQTYYHITQPVCDFAMKYVLKQAEKDEHMFFNFHENLLENPIHINHNGQTATIVNGGYSE